MSEPKRQQPQSAQSALRKMKLFAASLLVIAAVVYVLCLLLTDHHGGWGFTQSAAEASIVGGLADWFAVTALFRHPLGIPVPHTAIIPRKKNQIGESLAAFVEQHFLTVDVVGDRIDAARLPLRTGIWLANPAHAERVAREITTALTNVERTWHDEQLGIAVAAYADAQLRKIDVAPALSRVIEAIRAGGQHQLALTVVLRSVSRFLDENQAILRHRLAEESPEWVPEWIDDKVFKRLYAGLQNFVADLIASDSHELRRQYDLYLGAYAESLGTDPSRAAAVNTTKTELLEHPEVRQWLGTLWQRLTSAAVSDATSPDSQLQQTLASLIGRFGTSLRDDRALQRRIEEGLARSVEYVVKHYSHDISELISTTVSRWDAKDTSRRVELQVGRDLQFIRINGTVVGALVGLAIHAVSVLT